MVNIIPKYRELINLTVSLKNYVKCVSNMFIHFTILKTRINNSLQILDPNADKRLMSLPANLASSMAKMSCLGKGLHGQASILTISFPLFLGKCVAPLK